MTSFPRWLIRLHGRRTETCLRYACDAQGHVIGFEELESALDYLAKNLQAEMAIHRLKPVEAILLVADMHEFKVPGMCVNPSPEGICGAIVSLEALAAALNEAPLA
jgi:hypothetical protein